MKREYRAAVWRCRIALELRLKAEIKLAVADAVFQETEHDRDDVALRGRQIDEDQAARRTRARRAWASRSNALVSKRSSPPSLGRSSSG
jgi:hypothetical protein